MVYHFSPGTPLPWPPSPRRWSCTKRSWRSREGKTSWFVFHVTTLSQKILSQHLCFCITSQLLVFHCCHQLSCGDGWIMPNFFHSTLVDRGWDVLQWQPAMKKKNMKVYGSDEILLFPPFSFMLEWARAFVTWMYEKYSDGIWRYNKIKHKKCVYFLLAGYVCQMPVVLQCCRFI